MGTPIEKLPDPDSWTPEQAERAFALIDAIDGGQEFRGSPAKLEALRQALEYYELTVNDPEGELDGIEDFRMWRFANTPAGPADPKADAREAPQQPAPAPVAPQQPAQPRSGGLWDRAVAAGKKYGGQALQAVDDAASDALHALTRTDLTDKIGSYIATAIPVPGEGERVYRDDPTKTLQRQFQQDMRMREGRSPTLTGMADVGQAMAPAAAATLLAPIAAPAAGAMMGAAPLAPAATSFGGRIAAGALEGAAMGGAQRVGSAPVDDDSSSFDRWLEGAKVGGAVGAIIPASAGVIEEAAAPIAPIAEKLRYRMRAAAPGGYGAELKKLANREGLEYTDEQLGREIERLIPPKRFGIPRSPRDYHDAAAPKLQEAIETSGRAIDEATEAGVTVPLRGQPDDVGIMEGLDAVRSKAGKLHGSTNKGYARALEREARGVRGDFPGPENQRLTARQVQDVKLGLEEGGYPSNPVGNLSDSARARAQRDAATAPRQALDSAMRTQAPEDTFEAWMRAKGDIGPLDEITSMARARAAQESGNQMMSLPSSIAFAGGGAMGGGALTGSAEGGLLGAGAGLTSMLAAEGVKRYGRDATANLAMGVQRTAQGLAAPSVVGQRAAVAGVVPPVTSAAPARAQTSGMLDASPAMAQPDLEAERQADLDRAARILEIDPNNKHAKRALRLITGHE